MLDRMERECMNFMWTIGPCNLCDQPRTSCQADILLSWDDVKNVNPCCLSWRTYSNTWGSVHISGEQACTYKLRKAHDDCLEVLPHIILYLLTRRPRTTGSPSHVLRDRAAHSTKNPVKVGQVYPCRICRRAASLKDLARLGFCWPFRSLHAHLPQP